MFLKLDKIVEKLDQIFCH